MYSRKPSIIEHGVRIRPPRRRRSSRRRTGAALYGDDMQAVDGIDTDRLSYINTALAALPGMSLREYFVPIMRLKRSLLARKSLTRLRQPCDDAKVAEKRITDGLTHLAKALNDAAMDVLRDASFPLDVKAFVELLRDKVEPVSFEADGVLCYPNELPETLFVYIILTGSVTITQFQPQLRRGGTGGTASDRKQYFTSNKETLRLCGGGAVPEAALLGADPLGMAPLLDASADAVSVSNVTSAIQRSLRRASRSIGQPTLQATRSETLRAPTVVGAAEALGLAPFRSANCVATVTVVGKGDTAQYVGFTDTLRVRAVDVHAALLQLAQREMHAREEQVPTEKESASLWFSTPPGTVAPRGAARTMADFIAAARTKTLGTYYAQNELLMRQSWLLQDTPLSTIRNLISTLIPRTYMPGEVIACPHSTTSASRQLCFLRRGRLVITETPPSADRAAEGRLASRGGLSGGPHGACRCKSVELAERKVLEVVESGASFGELSVLFGEPRNYTLVAETTCDVWCLSHNDFSRTVRRDDALRHGLVEKAAALRMKWLGEQRYTAALVQHLRSCSELFRVLPDMALRLVQERIEPVVFAPGSLVTSTSERCQHMLVIIQGKVTSICDGVASYGPGDVLGESCLIAHRWPIGLSARTMVEGWRLRRERLFEALRLAEVLHSHSGEVTSQAQLFLKQIFAPPIPKAETDVVGRQRMPVVGPAPGGQGYVAFAERLAEVQLKALCFIFRDFVSWDDVKYATMSSSPGSKADAASDAVAREYVIGQMREALNGKRVGGGTSEKVASLLATGQSQSTEPRASTSGRRQTASPMSPGPEEANSTLLSDARGGGGGTYAVGSGRAAVMAHNSARRGPPHSVSARGAHSGRGSRPRPLGNSGACAFLVNPEVTTTPFVPHDRQQRRHGSRGARRGAGLSRDKGITAADENALSHSRMQRSASTMAHTIADVRGRHTLPPRLGKLTRTLAERDHALAVESKHEAALERKYGSKSPLQRTAGGPRAQRGNGSEADEGGLVVSSSAAAVGGEKPAPVHLFLSAEKPRAEITMEEAIAIGYVMQLPDPQHIQSSVSFVDPDVTIGLPKQRLRRQAMSITPNDRYSKHNFQFAAAVFDDDGDTLGAPPPPGDTAIGKGLRHKAGDGGAKSEEELRLAKAKKLLTMMRASVVSRVGRTSSPPLSHHPSWAGGAGAASPDGITGGVSGQEAIYMTDPLGSVSREASPMASMPRRASDVVSPVRGASLSVEASSSAPSPYTGTPGRRTAATAANTVQRRSEVFLQLLQRDPLRALDQLYDRYQLPWASAGSLPTLFASTPQDSAVYGDGVQLGRAEASTASTRRPSLLERLRDAATYSELHPSTTPREASGGKDTGDVMLTNTAGAVPPLVVAGPRDRRVSQPLLVLPPSTSNFNLTGSTSAEVAAAATATGANPFPDNGGAVAAKRANLDTFLRTREAVLFVDSFGALSAPVARSSGRRGSGGGPVVLPRTADAATALTAQPSVAGSQLEDSMSVGTATTAYQFPDGTAPGQRDPFLARTSSASTAAFDNPDGRDNGPRSRRASSAQPLGPQDFVMPDADEAEAVMRRIQRDVDGLNAVAKEQTKERDRQRARESRLGPRVAEIEAALSHPNTDEEQLLDDWCTVYQLKQKDPLQAILTPRALLPYAGPDYLWHELQQMRHVDADEALRIAARSGVEAWQDQMVESKLGGGKKRGPNAARRVVAAIGTAQLGSTSTPLTNPAQRLDETGYEKWVEEREAFFTAYMQHLHGAPTTERIREPSFPPNHPQ